MSKVHKKIYIKSLICQSTHPFKYHLFSSIKEFVILKCEVLSSALLEVIRWLEI
jgi:hypothetical protein